MSETIRTTAELAEAIKTYDAAREHGPSERTPEPTPSILDTNPHRRPGDPSLSEWGALSLSELDELDELDAGLSERLFKAAAWDERRAAGNWRQEKEASRAAEHEEIGRDPAKTAAYLEAQDAERFRQRFWSLSPGEREEHARRLGIDAATFTPPEHPYDS